jgi:hypothetical protein
MNYKKNNILSVNLYFISFALNIFLTIVLFSSLTNKELAVYFDADDLFIPALYKDLIINNSSIHGWQLGTSTYLFPNIIAYFTIQTITKNFILTAYLLSLIQFAVFILFINKVVKEASIFFSNDILTMANLLISFFILIGVNEYRIALHYYYPLHMGVFIIALINIYFSLKFLKKPYKKYIIFITLLNILAIASDGIYIVFYILPSLVALSLTFLKNKNKNFKELFFINLISLLAGKLFLWLLKLTFQFKSQEPGIIFSNILSSLTVCLNQFYDNLFSGNLKTIIWLLSITSFILTLVYIFINIKSEKNAKQSYHYFYIWFIIAFSVIVFFAPVLTGIYFDYSNIRYNIFVYYFLLGNFAFVLLHLFNVQKLLQYINIIVVLFIIIYILLKVSFSDVYKGIKRNLNYYPEIAIVVDQLSKSENLKAGVADYWQARVITMFSKNEKLVNHVYLSRLSPFNFLNNMNNYLYYPNDSIIWYNFIVNHSNVDTTFIRSTFRDYEVINCGNYSIIKVPEFKYDPYNFSIVLKDSIK